MCEFKRPPALRYDDLHLGDGNAAPNCIIRVWIMCRSDFCVDGTIEVQIVDQETGEELTDFVGVTCAGNDVRHDIAMKLHGPLQFRRAKAVFRCCDTTKEGAVRPIWVRCQ